MPPILSKRLAAIEAKMPQQPPSEDVLYRSQWFADFLARRGLVIDLLPKVDGSILRAMPLDMAEEMRAELLEARP